MRPRPALLFRLFRATALGSSALLLAAGPSWGAPRKAQMGDERIVVFKASPFPYFGQIPEQNTPFLMQGDDGRQFHDSPRGGRLYLDQTYSDRRSLLVTPPAFDPSRPGAAILLFFHGNLAKLRRDVIDRQGVAQQLFASRLNAVLVAPQLAIDALDSSAGHFWESGFFDAYLTEAAQHLAEGQGYGAEELDRLPIIIVAYSGGYLPAAFSLHYAQAQSRIRGVILLDALFGEEAKFRDWIERTRGATFFVSAYSKASAPLNLDLIQQLKTAQFAVKTSLPGHIAPGDIVFEAALSAEHNDFVTQASRPNPLADILRRLKH